MPGLALTIPMLRYHSSMTSVPANQNNQSIDKNKVSFLCKDHNRTYILDLKLLFTKTQPESVLLLKMEIIKMNS